MFVYNFSFLLPPTTLMLHVDVVAPYILRVGTTSQQPSIHPAVLALAQFKVRKCQTGSTLRALRRVVVIVDCTYCFDIASSKIDDHTGE